MPDGYLVCIEHVAVRKSKETLGVHTCPSGEIESCYSKCRIGTRLGG